MRSIPNPGGQPITWDSPQQAQSAGALFGAATGAGLGGTIWYLAAQAHPVGKYAGVAFPLLGAVLGYMSWNELLRPTPLPRAVR